MAEAMLDEEYKSSHTDLKDYGEESEKREQALKSDVDEETPTTEEREEESHKKDIPTPKKSEQRSVVIQVPPKRQKLCSAFTAKEVVQGKFIPLKMKFRAEMTAKYCRDRNKKSH